jgi:hypothetical protein
VNGKFWEFPIRSGFGAELPLNDHATLHRGRNIILRKRKRSLLEDGKCTMNHQFRLVRERFSWALNRRRHRLVIVGLVFVAAMGSLAGFRASTNSKSSTGPAVNKRVASLDFVVAKNDQESPFRATNSSTVPSTAKTATEAVRALTDAALKGNADLAWSTIAPVDQTRIGYKQRIIEDVRAAGWTTVDVVGSTSSSVSLHVTQIPRISEVDGVTMRSAEVIIPTIVVGTDTKVLWSRRTTHQMYPDRSSEVDQKVADTALAWAKSKQACTTNPASEFANGLSGVVGLGPSLCGTTKAIVVGAVGDLDALDDPQPIIEEFGASAMLWGRVVTLGAPIPMQVVLAPFGDEWVVVALAHTPLADSSPALGNPSTTVSGAATG